MVDKDPEKQKKSVPDSIKKFYSKFCNKNSLQTFNVMGTIFEIDSNYEILDSSNYFFKSGFSLY